MDLFIDYVYLLYAIYLLEIKQICLQKGKGDNFQFEISVKIEILNYVYEM